MKRTKQYVNAIINFMQLLWTHTLTLAGCVISHSQGQRTPGGQKKRYRDHLHSILKLCTCGTSRLYSAFIRVLWLS